MTIYRWIIGLLAVNTVFIASAATITVNDNSDTTDTCSTNGTGNCTLRDAITFANSNSGADTIEFNIPGAGVHTIVLTSLLPQITDPLTIDGYSQPGAQPNTNSADQGLNTVLRIEIDGRDQNLQNASFGCLSIVGVNSPSTSTIKGLAIYCLPPPIRIFGINASGSVIEGNFIGTDASGTMALSDLTGISLSDINNLRIGGLQPSQRNLIAGFTRNNAGFAISGEGTGINNLQIQGNLIGTNASGTVVLGNHRGAISLQHSVGATIGGPTSNARNIIAGSQFYAIGIGNSGGATVNNNLIQGNYIGTDVSGSNALSNQNGIRISGMGSNTISDNVIAGNERIGVDVSSTDTTVSNNRIGISPTDQPLGNGHIGIQIGASNNTIENNIIAYNGGDPTQNASGGIACSGTSNATSNAILGNSIFANINTSTFLQRGLGIDLKQVGLGGIGDGITLNDDLDTDEGCNGLQNFPLLQTVAMVANNITIGGSLNSAANETYRLEFFANDACDPSGHGEGQTFLGVTQVTTNVNGFASFNTTLNTIAGQGRIFTATATDADSNTSEFSACFGGNTEFTISSTPTTILEGNQMGAMFGESVANAGDINRDGNPDLIVGAPFFNNGAGIARVFFGTVNGISASSPQELEINNQSNAQFGFAVAGLGDINNDNFDDVAVGAPLFNDGETDEGAVFIYLGSSSGLQTPAFRILQSNQIGANMGFSIAGIGDVNADGFNDIGIGMPSFGSNLQSRQVKGGNPLNTGAIAALLGGLVNAISNNPDIVIPGTQAGAGLGSSIAGAGDVNADGFDDIIAGEPNRSNGNMANAGAATIFPGSNVGPQANAIAQFLGAAANAVLGTSVAGIGDANRDGFDDVAVGSPGHSNPEDEEGAVHVYLGGTNPSPDPAITLESNRVNSRMGESVVRVEDVNGDSVPEIMAGAPGTGNNPAATGSVFLFESRFGSLYDDTPHSILGNNRPNSAFGRSVTALGSSDQRGVFELAVGAPRDDEGQSEEGLVSLFRIVKNLLIDDFDN